MDTLSYRTASANKDTVNKEWVLPISRAAGDADRIVALMASSFDSGRGHGVTASLYY